MKCLFTIDVVSSLKQFRAIATKYGVSEEWTGRVETTIIEFMLQFYKKCTRE